MKFTFYFFTGSVKRLFTRVASFFPAKILHSSSEQGPFYGCVEYSTYYETVKFLHLNKK